MPKGAVGSWMTKKLKSVLGGRPEKLTSMYSTCPTGVIVTDPLAEGAQTAPPADTSMSNETGDYPAQLLAGMANIAIISWINFFISLPLKLVFRCEVNSNRTTPPVLLRN